MTDSSHLPRGPYPEARGPRHASPEARQATQPLSVEVRGQGTGTRLPEATGWVDREAEPLNLVRQVAEDEQAEAMSSPGSDSAVQRR